MKLLSFLLATTLVPAYFYGQTYTTTSQGKNYNNGGAYVAPVVTKTYPAYVPPRASSESRNRSVPVNQSSYNYSKNNRTSSSGAVTSYPVVDEAKKRKEMGLPFLKTSYNLLYELNPVPHYRKFGYVNKNGQVMIPYKYDDALDFSEDRAVVSLDGKQTYIDTRGNEMPFQYDWCLGFSDGMGAVSLNGLWGYVDINGTVVVPLAFTAAGSFSEGLSCVKSGEKYGYINKKGATVLPFKFLTAHRFNDGMARVTLDQDGQVKTGFIDHSGTLVVPAMYEAADGFSEGRAAVKLNSKWAFIDKNGKEVTRQRYEKVEYFFEGLAAVQKDKGGKWGFIDKNGTEVIALQYDYARNFNEGLAGVKTGDFYSFINNKGEVVIPAGYYDVFIDFSNGIATVLSKQFVIHKIDKTGKKVTN